MPIEKFMNAAEIPPNGPNMKIATNESMTWYAGEPILGRYRRTPEGGAGSVVVTLSVCMQSIAAK
jgi:hypothetical protein